MAWFRYELDFACRWCPALYTEEPVKPPRDHAYRYGPTVEVPNGEALDAIAARVAAPAAVEA